LTQVTLSGKRSKVPSTLQITKNLRFHRWKQAIRVALVDNRHVLDKLYTAWISKLFVRVQHELLQNILESWKFCVMALFRRVGMCCILPNQKVFVNILLLHYCQNFFAAG